MAYLVVYGKKIATRVIGLAMTIVLSLATIAYGVYIIWFYE